MEDRLQLHDIKVTNFLTVSIIIVFSLYLTSAIKSIPCNNDVMSSFLSNFVHVDPYHLMANIFALYALSKVEREIGSKKFTGLVIFLLIFNTIAEVAVNKVFRDLPCSIGFSGVLFGIMTWEIVTKKDIDMVLISSIVSMVLLPSMKNKKVSFIGHTVGAISGVIGGVLYKNIIKILAHI